MRERISWLATALMAAALVGTALIPDLLPAPDSAASSPGPIVVAEGEGTTQAAPQMSVRAVADRVRPAVVQITNEQVIRDQFGRTAIGGAGIGSGVIYDPNGLILTNNHVVAGAQSLTVSLPDGRVYQGKLLGGDPQMDLAVVKIEPQASEVLPVAVLGNSDALAVGDGLVAIGNALGLPGGPTVTAGVVSALNRAIQEPSETPGEPGPYLYDLIQTDAAINPGNSGGPLLNMAGEVVGINTLAAGSDGAVTAQGIGFAIAITTARPIADQLVTQGRVAHPFLGISYTLVTAVLARQFDLPAKQGVVITKVGADTAAARAGLKARDVITVVDGQAVVDETTLGRVLSRRKPGEAVQLTVARGNQQLTLDIVLGEQPGG